ncbi:MAG: aldehyde dehydrogenase family protein, partial [Desulfocapsa sp.]|nr:aldehyde dehydrogenase family protein [Desulfocapsa sp.]
MKLEDQGLFKQECYLNGEWVGSKETIDVHNPADNKLLGMVPSLDAKITKETIDAAQDAYLLWKNLTAKERSDYLRKWFDLIIAHKTDLARIMTSEQGKPLKEAEGEVLYGASYVEWFAEEAKRVYGDTIPMAQPGKRIVVLKEPVGVCAAITPWNFPSAMITRKSAPALAAGCPVVVKPAAQTPFSAMALAELAHRAGMPRGVFNVITGPAREIGAEMTASPIV